MSRAIEWILLGAGSCLAIIIGVWLRRPARIGPWMLLAGAVAFGATATAWNAVGNLILVRELPGSVAGRMAGVLQGGFYAGFATGPACFGALVDLTSSYAAGWSMVIVVMALAAGVLGVAGRRP